MWRYGWQDGLVVNPISPKGSTEPEIRCVQRISVRRTSHICKTPWTAATRGAADPPVVRRDKGCQLCAGASYVQVTTLRLFFHSGVFVVAVRG